MSEENCNVSFLPREMLKWLNSLDLAYEIRNIKRDLANGFVVAEMLQRYYPKEVNIFTFYNGLNEEQKKDNWKRIAEVLNKKQFDLKQEEYMSILHRAPQNALIFIVKLYQFLTNKKVDPQWMQRAFQSKNDYQPNYLKKTANFLSKDREITRIQDQIVQKKVLEETILKHELQSKQERAEMNLDEYMISKKRAKQELLRSQKQEIQLIRQQQTEIQNNQEIIEIPIKTFNNERNNKKTEVIIEGREITDLLTKSCKSQCESEPLNKEIAEYKLEESVNKPIYVFSNVLDFSKKSIKLLVMVLIENINQIVEVLNNNYSEFKVFFNLILEPLDNLQLEFKAYRCKLIQRKQQQKQNINLNKYQKLNDYIQLKVLVQFLQELGNQLMRIDGISTQMFFENICLQRLLEIQNKYGNKRASIIQIINCYCQQDSSSKLRIIKKTKDLFKSDINKFMGFVSYFIENGFELEIDDEFFNLLLYYSMISLDSPSAITRTRGLKLINEIIHVNYKPILNLLNKFGKFTTDSWWECRAQLLILTAQALIYLATENNESQLFDNQSQEIEKENSLSNEKTEKNNKENDENNKKIQLQKMQENENQKKENQEYLLSLIYEMFQINTNEIILRIGLIYLSPVTNYYNQLCDRYLEIMMNINENIRDNVLDIQAKSGQEEGQIVNGCNSFKYKLTGVCLNWNCCGIAESLNVFIKSQKQFERFEKDHLDIIKGCMVNKLNDHQSQQWFDIYENIKEYLFLSLCEKHLCTLASQILKKFFTFHKITEQVLISSQEVLLNILSLIYHPDSDQFCQTNLLDFFKYLTNEAEFFKQYIYNIVKNFSENNIPYFLKSNLTLFMNELSKERKLKLQSQQQNQS